MKLAKCETGHFFDGDKYPECPYCNVALQKDSGTIVAAATGAQGSPAVASGPVSGWLVVTRGAGTGRDLRLGVGRSFLGLDAGGAPQLLSADSPLSVRQAVVVYDPQANTFTALPGTAAELAYLGGEALLTPQPLVAGASLRLGEATLQFVPFCGDFRWETQKPDSPKPVKQKNQKTDPAAQKGGTTVGK